MIETNGYEYEYNSGYWQSITSSNNCYSYAINNPATSGGTQQPGALAGVTVSVERDENKNINFPKYENDIIEAVKADFMAYFNLSNENALQNYFREVERDELCPEGTYKIAFGVGYDGVDVDYHFYRQDASGYWSHKQGRTLVTNVDSNGSLLPDPYYIDDMYYLVGYYMVVPWKSENVSLNTLNSSALLSNESNFFINNYVTEIAIISLGKNERRNYV
jgi:hypothetical protein